MANSSEPVEPPAALEDAQEAPPEAAEAAEAEPVPKRGRGRPAGSKTVNRKPKVEVVLQPVETAPPAPKPRSRKREPKPAPEPEPAPLPAPVVQPPLSPAELRRQAMEESVRRRQADYEARKAYYTNMLQQKMFAF
jgi:hypothetical protein